MGTSAVTVLNAYSSEWNFSSSHFLQVLPIKEDIKLNNNNKKRNINLINFIPNYTINPITISYSNSWREYEPKSPWCIIITGNFITH